MVKNFLINFIKGFGFLFVLFLFVIFANRTMKLDHCLLAIWGGSCLIVGFSTGILGVIADGSRKGSPKFVVEDLNVENFRSELQDGKTSNSIVLEKLGLNENQLGSVPAAAFAEALNRILLMSDFVNYAKMDYPMPDPDPKKRLPLRQSNDARLALDSEAAGLLETWIDKGSSVLTPEETSKLNRGLLEILYPGGIKHKRITDIIIYILLGLIIVGILMNFFTGVYPLAILNRYTGRVIWSMDGSK
jgi:hypothetical protein